RIDCARRRASSGATRNRWNAMRCADFGPTPGSRPSSSIRFWTAPSYTATQSAQQTAEEIVDTTAEAAKTLRRRAHLRGPQPPCLRHAFARRRDGEVFECFDVFGIDDIGVDRYPLQVTVPVDRRLHHTTARAAFDGLVRERVLRGL